MLLNIGNIFGPKSERIIHWELSLKLLGRDKCPYPEILLLVVLNYSAHQYWVTGVILRDPSSQTLRNSTRFFFDSGDFSGRDQMETSDENSTFPGLQL